MTGHHDIARAWETIERVLAEHLPEVAATLRPPATDAQLARLADAVGELPEDFAAGLRIHDGQDNPTRLLDVYDHLTFLSVDAMLEHHEMRIDALGDDVDTDEYDWMSPERVRAIPNCRGWLQFTDSEGEGHALDLDPLPAGERGQIIWLPVDGPTPEPVAPSYGAWLADLAQRLDAGAFRVDPDLGLWLERSPAEG